jgi:hypothetical protein
MNTQFVTLGDILQESQQAITWLSEGEMNRFIQEGKKYNVAALAFQPVENSVRRLFGERAIGTFNRTDLEKFQLLAKFLMSLNDRENTAPAALAWQVARGLPKTAMEIVDAGKEAIQIMEEISRREASLKAAVRARRNAPPATRTTAQPGWHKEGRNRRKHKPTG